LGAEGYKLLSGLLDYDPEKRLTAQQALQHPFFSTGDKVSSSCFEGLNFENFRIDWEQQRNNIAAIGAGLLFSLGIWLYIDTAVVYKHDWNNIYVLVTIASCVAMFMVNSVSNNQIHGGSYDYGGILGTRGARLWLMLAFFLTFAALVASVWLLFSEYVLRQGNDPKWPGVALFLNNFLIFGASIVYKFGRLDNHSDY